MNFNSIPPANFPSPGIPPTGGSSVNKPCEHRFIYLEKRRVIDKNMDSTSMTKQVDIFYCEKCLEYRQVDY